MSAQPVEPRPWVEAEFDRIDAALAELDRRCVELAAQYRAQDFGQALPPAPVSSEAGRM